MNCLLHQEIARITKWPENDPTVVDIIQSIDPLLWDFITEATRTVRECRGVHSAATSSWRTHSKPIQQLFCLSVKMFCINPRCNFPFHIPLTEAVISYGGTLKLIHMLNRVGAAASVDAHSRKMEDVLEKSDHQLEHKLSSDAFRVFPSTTLI